MQFTSFTARDLRAALHDARRRLQDPAATPFSPHLSTLLTIDDKQALTGRGPGEHVARLLHEHGWASLPAEYAEQLHLTGVVRHRLPAPRAGQLPIWTAVRHLLDHRCLRAYRAAVLGLRAGTLHPVIRERDLAGTLYELRAAPDVHALALVSARSEHPPLWLAQDEESPVLVAGLWHDRPELFPSGDRPLARDRHGPRPTSMRQLTLLLENARRPSPTLAERAEIAARGVARLAAFAVAGERGARTGVEPAAAIAATAAYRESRLYVPPPVGGQAMELPRLPILPAGQTVLRSAEAFAASVPRTLDVFHVLDAIPVLAQHAIDWTIAGDVARCQRAADRASLAQQRADQAQRERGERVPHRPCVPAVTGPLLDDAPRRRIAGRAVAIAFAELGLPYPTP